jgi:hypothetical protein
MLLVLLEMMALLGESSIETSRLQLHHITVSHKVNSTRSRSALMAGLIM